MSVLDEDREGSPSFAVTEDNVTVVKKTILKDGCITVKQLSSETRISVESIELLLHEHLDTKKFLHSGCLTF